MSKEFKFTADITFEAENIDDALALLREHFRGLPDGGEGLEFIGEMHLKPIEKDV